jgi:hypothetical protein
VGAGDKIMPDDYLTRAQIVTIINRLIGRDDSYDVAGIVNPYTDLTSGDWYYFDIIKASFGFGDEPDPNDGLYKVDPERKLPLSEIDFD